MDASKNYADLARLVRLIADTGGELRTSDCNVLREAADALRDVSFAKKAWRRGYDFWHGEWMPPPPADFDSSKQRDPLAEGWQPVLIIVDDAELRRRLNGRQPEGYR